MKNYFLMTVLIATTLLSCISNDKDKSLENVRKSFPHSKIYNIEGQHFTYYLVDSTGIKKVETLNFSNENISSVEFLIERK